MGWDRPGEAPKTQGACPVQWWVESCWINDETVACTLFFFDPNILHWHPHWHSMLTMPSKHFHMTASHVFSQVFQLLKLYTPHRRVAQIIQNMNCSCIVWKWPWTRWKNITIRQLLLMHIPLWWVCVLFFSFFVIHLIFLIVLDPDTKMSHFTKHWTKSLQDIALKPMETIVCLLPLV